MTEVSDIKMLDGRPKIFFIEACRGQESNLTQVMMTKSGPLPQQIGISLPSKQDVFVGFATVPGFVSFTSLAGSPYLQALARNLHHHHTTLDLSDIHLLVKRELATTKLAGGNRQGAEERSSLLYKLLFSKYSGDHRGSVKFGTNKYSSFGTKSSTFNITQQQINPQDLLESDNRAMIPIQIEKPSISTQRARSEFFSSMSPRASYISPTQTSSTSSTIGKPPRSAMYNYSGTGNRISVCQESKSETGSSSSQLLLSR